MFRRKSPLSFAAPWALACALLSPGTAAADRAPVDFARDVQPLLASRCYDCHGADKAKGGLRLTSRASAFAGGESGDPLLVPGASARSALFHRITTADENDVMPQKGDRLTPAEVELLRRWIDEGAPWPEDQRHWAYVKPLRPAVPQVKPAAFAPRNPIDAFVLARLEREGLRASPETDRARWLRRVSLDLIGLPPTPGERAEFLRDTSDTAYERVVDRLLASPHYGERWARPWLDLARYADSHGFQRDDLREIWPYRDWVIRAMNADLPFDQFTIWQIAGDLVAAPEGSEVRGQMSEARGLISGVRGQTSEVRRQMSEGRRQTSEGKREQAEVTDQKPIASGGAGIVRSDEETHWPVQSLEPSEARNAKRETRNLRPEPRNAKRPSPDSEHRIQNSEVRTQNSELDLLIATGFHRAAPTNVEAGTDQEEGRVNQVFDRVNTTAAVWLGTTLECAQCHNHKYDPFSQKEYYQLFAFFNNTPKETDFTTPKAMAALKFTGPYLELPDPAQDGQREELRRRIAELDTQIAAASERLLPQMGAWEQRVIRALAVPAQTQALDNADVPSSGSPRDSAVAGEKNPEPLPANIAAILQRPRETRTPAQSTRLSAYFLAQDKELAALKQARSKASQELVAVRGPQTLVMRELEQPRETTVLNRGNFLEPGERVTPGTPAILHALNVAQPKVARPSRLPGSDHTTTPIPPPGAGETPALREPAARADRLDLARWLVSPENPLVARVTVNRWWAEFFGRGIVSTVEDFGVKGEPPTHRELLDWLAVEFMERGWSMKHIHKLIVLSGTYRQSSRVTPELLARDDQNKLYARGPRFRLDAETIRDNALAAAGLLNLKLGGPPVRPYQPPGLWENKVGGDRVTYEVSPGDDAWRRGIYTVWKRSSPYPSFINFDATARTACTVKRSRSNTPLQALTLLNDPVYVEAALALALRVLTERPDASTAERIRYAFQLCLTREPSDREVAALRQLLDEQAAAVRAQPRPLAKGLGTTKPPAHTTEDEFAGWHAVATALLNLDEMITKG